MRRPLPAVLIVLGILTALPSRSAAAQTVHVHDDPVLTAIANDEARGALDADDALWLRLQLVFDPGRLPALYRAGASGPVRCATAIVAEAHRRREELEPARRALLDAWLAPTVEAAAIVPSARGRFELEYQTEGIDAVPLEDVAPANGIPDFVERVGGYFEESWDREFDALGFVAPDISVAPYRVSFRRINAYGLTERTSEGSAGTTITVHNSYLNFPPNQDPEGTRWGAAKVTAAHELKHASQFANNGWTETGLWVEVDATWIEDLVYDQVNDFYTYIGFGSPITAPTSPLDAGGSGAYAECVWQHWMSETWGNDVIVGFWNRRAAQPLEAVLDTYDWVLGQVEAPLRESWIDFASWNFATGERARTGFGYEEAANFPTAPPTDTSATLPASFNGSVERLAANFLRVEGFTPGATGVVVVAAQVPAATPLRARAFVDRRDGGFTVETILLDPALDAELATPLSEIEAVTLILGHGDLDQGPALYQIDVREEVRVPLPLAATNEQEIRFRMAAGSVASRQVDLANEGEAGSVLDFRALVIEAAPAIPARSIVGSTLEVEPAAYTPATTVDLQLRVTNASVDFEWLKSVEIDFPAGIEVLASTDLLGPEDRHLASSNTTGDAVTLVWSDADGAWGNLRHGESATASVRVAFDVTTNGDLLIPYRIQGDGFGGGPSEVNGAVLLEGPRAPLFEVSRPGSLVAAGEALDVAWLAGVSGEVGIDLSRDGGATWETLADATANDGAWSTTASGPTTFDAVLRVRSVTDPADFGLSPGRFAIVVPIGWAQVLPQTGSLAAGEGTALEIRFDATTLSTGTYDATLAIGAAGVDEVLRVPVILEISADGTASPDGRRRVVVHPARPNPFNPQTRIAFDLDRERQVRVDVFDTRGRHVRSIDDRTFSPGPQSVVWNATDATGRRVASGVYLVAVDIDGERTLEKITLAK